MSTRTLLTVVWEGDEDVFTFDDGSIERLRHIGTDVEEKAKRARLIEEQRLFLDLSMWRWVYLSHELLTRLLPTQGHQVQMGQQGTQVFALGVLFVRPEGTWTVPSSHVCHAYCRPVWRAMGMACGHL